MSRLPAEALLLIVAVMVAGCAADHPVAEAESAAAFDDVKTPPAVSESDSPATEPAAPVVSTPVSVETETGSQETASNGTAASPENSADNPPIEIVPESPEETPKEPLPVRTTIAGAWEFLVCSFGTDLIGMLVEIEADGDSHTAVIKDTTAAMPGWTIQSTELTESDAHIVFLREDGGAVDFVGELQDDGIIRGNVAFGENGLSTVRWLPSERSSLEGVDPSTPSENVDAMVNFIPSEGEDGLAELREKATELGGSALACELYDRINSIIFRRQRPSEDMYAGLPEKYVAAADQWGPRVVARAHLEIAHTMAVCGYSLEQTKEHLQLARKLIGDEVRTRQQSQLDLIDGLVSLHSDDQAEQQSGVETLGKIREEDPYNADATLALADYFERSDRLEEALALQAEMYVLQPGSGDGATAQRLWSELSRDPEGFEDYLNDVYRSRIYQFAEEVGDAQRASTGRTVLGELFTGTSCPPCVAADVATGGLEVTYPKTEFIMLRYHEHSPAPDSLATADGELRGAMYYRALGTPSLYLNGRRQDPQIVQGIAGPIFFAPIGYESLREVVDSLLSEPSKVSIELSAEANGESIAFSAVASAAEPIPENWRLRIALAESGIPHRAPNGVRVHEMIVRTMPGGLEGTAPTEGKLEFKGSVSLQDVRQEIQDYLSRIPGLPLPPMDMKNLHVVAFVQDDSDRQVLQAAAVPVEGTPAVSAAEEKSPTEEASSEEASTGS